MSRDASEVRPPSVVLVCILWRDAVAQKKSRHIDMPAWMPMAPRILCMRNKRNVIIIQCNVNILFIVFVITFFCRNILNQAAF